MSLPAVTITELDGALGVLPPTSGRLLAIVGPSSSGTVALPATYARTKDIVAAYGSGPLVEAAAHYVERYGRGVVLVRTAASTPASAGTIDVSGKAGTSVVTVTGTPSDDVEAVLRVVTGGTVGTAGITLVWSLDGGRTWSPVTSLGTASSFALPGAGGLAFALAAGTLVAGDVVSTRATCATWNSTDLAAALDALAASSVSWELVEIVGAIDSAAFDVLELKIAALAAAGKPRAWIGHARVPNAGESEAAYLSSLSTALGAKASTSGMLCAGAVKLTSSVSGRRYRRPASYAIAARQAAASEEVDIAALTLGPLSGVSIRDDNGNPDEHDEAYSPGLDDARFCTLRTVEGYEGVYVTRPRLFSPAGSDFQLMPHRRVLALAEIALRVYFLARLSQTILVDATTGYILESEALEIEAGARAALRAALLAKPKASAISVAVSRIDNLLSTRTMHVDARVVPLAYVEWIDLTVGFYNPALAVQAV